jgi:acetyl-CoA carboxylase biotin carboxyl carrier protein
MDLKQIKDLIKEVLQSDISEFELEHSSTKIRLKRGISRESMIPPLSHSQPISVSIAPPQSIATEAILHPVANNEEASEDSTIHIVTSPIVGTVYRAPSPGSEPYVKLGDQVNEGSILCLVEAMKLMNEIPSDMEGEVVRIYIENGSPVEFGQKLFGIRPQKQG